MSYRELYYPFRPILWEIQPVKLKVNPPKKRSVGSRYIHIYIYIWSNYSDLTRPHPKWWFSKGNPLISGKSRLVKYYNLARYIYIYIAATQMASIFEGKKINPPPPKKQGPNSNQNKGFPSNDFCPPIWEFWSPSVHHKTPLS